MIEITFLDGFEEIRFVAELLLAVHLFGTMFSKRKEHFWKMAVVSGILLSGISLFYPIVILHRFTFSKMGLLTIILNSGWYCLLVAFAYIIILLCYKLSKVDALFVCTMGYALQHIEFVFINEWLAKRRWMDLTNHVFLYVVICIGSTMLLYAGVYLIFHHFFDSYQEGLFFDTPQNFLIMTGMLFMLIVCTFMCQTIFTAGRMDYDTPNTLGGIVDIIVCVLVLSVGFSFGRIHMLNQEKEIIEQLLYERKRQYELSKENIDVINSKCHDLKHQIKALEQVDEGERSAYIKELEEAIEIYDSVLNTGNEVVDTILSEKSLNCEKRNIRLSCICDASHLDFMSTLDIYALLGNALDNAIETVSKYKDVNKRVISLSIKAVGDFLSIQTENYCQGEVTFENGLPVTIKRNKAYHGYGMKSMRHIAEKYGGSLVCGAKNNSFTLQILLPMPAEFLRLYELREQEQKESTV